MHDAVSPYVRGQERLQLKWPNDLLVGPAKVGGILVESSTYGGDVVAIVGTGLNIAVSPPVSEREVGRLADFGDCPPPAELLPEIQASAFRWLDTWQRGENFAEVRAAWLERGIKAGERLTVHAGGEVVGGAFAGLAEDGSMLLDMADGATRTISFGDVTLPGERSKAEVAE